MAPGHKVREALDAADDARLKLRLGTEGPLPDALLVVEELAGVPVAILDLREGLAGAYGRRRGQPFIFLNGNDPVVRQRFTLAHELGHHWLGHRPVIDTSETVSGRTNDLDEIQANYFAGAFLLPRAAIDHWAVRSGVDRFDLEKLVRLAATFSASAQMARVRLEICGRLSAAEKARLDEALGQGQHRGLAALIGVDADGPADQIAEVKRTGELPRLPKLMYEYGMRGLSRGLVDPDRLADALGRERGWVDQQIEELGLARLSTAQLAAEMVVAGALSRAEGEVVYVSAGGDAQHFFNTLKQATEAAARP